MKSFLMKLMTHWRATRHTEKQTQTYHLWVTNDGGLGWQGEGGAGEEHCEDVALRGLSGDRIFREG